MLKSDPSGKLFLLAFSLEEPICPTVWKNPDLRNVCSRLAQFREGGTTVPQAALIVSPVRARGEGRTALLTRVSRVWLRTGTLRFVKKQGGSQYWVRPKPPQTFYEKNQGKLSAAKYNSFTYLRGYCVEGLVENQPSL